MPANTAQTPQDRLATAIAVENGSRPMPSSLVIGVKYSPITWRMPMAMPMMSPADSTTTHKGRGATDAGGATFCISRSPWLEQRHLCAAAFLYSGRAHARHEYFSGLP